MKERGDCPQTLAAVVVGVWGSGKQRAGTAHRCCWPCWQQEGQVVNSNHLQKLAAALAEASLREGACPAMVTLHVAYARQGGGTCLPASVTVVPN